MFVTIHHIKLNRILFSITMTKKIFDGFEDDETDSGDENTDPSFDESVECKNMMIKASFSLEFM